MAKRPPRRVPSDDYVVTQGGVQYHEHEGEYILVTGRPSIGELDTLADFIKTSNEERPEPPEAPEEDAPEEEQAAYRDAIREFTLLQSDRSQRVNLAFDRMCKVVGDHLAGWTWTNPEGKPLVPWNAEDEEGRPYARLEDAAAAVSALEPNELIYLRNVLVNGESQVERKNELNGSEPSSTGKALSRSKAR